MEEGAGVPDGKLRITWIAGTNNFCLATIGQVLEVEAKCGVGLRNVLKRLQEETWGIYDVIWPIRCGLIGGGDVSVMEAEAICQRHVYPPNALAVSVLMSIDIISAACVGVIGDEVGKGSPDRAAERENPSSTPRADSSDLQSTASGRQSAGRLRRRAK